MLPVSELRCVLPFLNPPGNTPVPASHSLPWSRLIPALVQDFDKYSWNYISVPALKQVGPAHVEAPTNTSEPTSRSLRWTGLGPTLVQITSVAQSCPALCDTMNLSTPGLPVQHQLPEFTETHVQQDSDAIQPSHPLSSPAPPAPTPSQHQRLFQWVNTWHEVAKVLEFPL